jgi:hypothetical protein
MALTPGGLPYPLGTDKVVDGDDAIKNLAIGVDTRPLARAVLATGGNLSPNIYLVVGQGGGFGSPELRGVTWNSDAAIFTVPIAGLYRVAYGVAYAGSATPGAVRAARLDNGASTTLASTYLSPTAGQLQTLSGSRLLRMVAGASVRLLTYHEAPAGATILTSDTYLFIEWAGV